MTKDIMTKKASNIYSEIVNYLDENGYSDINVDVESKIYANGIGVCIDGMHTLVKPTDGWLMRLLKKYEKSEYNWCDFKVSV